ENQRAKGVDDLRRLQFEAAPLPFQEGAVMGRDHERRKLARADVGAEGALRLAQLDDVLEDVVKAPVDVADLWAEPRVVAREIRRGADGEDGKLGPADAELGLLMGEGDHLVERGRSGPPDALVHRIDE